MAHELGHWAATDVLRMLIAGQISLSITLTAVRIFLFDTDVYRAFGFAPGLDGKLPIIIGINLAMAMISPLNTVTSFAVNALSRSREFAADKFAVNLGYAERLSEALVKLMGSNKAITDYDPLYSALHHSHPALPERLGAIESARVEKDRKR